MVSFAAITPRVASQRVFIFVSVHFVIDSVRKLLDTLSYSFEMSAPVHAKEMHVLQISVQYALTSASKTI
jgi:hypothetical protein